MHKCLIDEPPTGIMLVNLGSPEAPTAQAIARFLRVFLSDPRVVPLPRWLWVPILHGKVLRQRPKQLAPLYNSIWQERGSPLLVSSEDLQNGLQSWAQETGNNWVVELAMTYGQQSIADALRRLAKQKVRQIVVLPLYPQYSTSTTAAVFDQLKNAPASCVLRPVHDYHDHPAYISALGQHIHNYWSTHGRADKLLLSYHGLPISMHKQCPSYYQQCLRTSELLRAELELEATQFSVCFQSRAGRRPWLQPYTDDVIKQCLKQGHRHVQIACPGFASDCLETLEEVDAGYRDMFLQLGGERWDYIPALNAEKGHVHALSQVIQTCLDLP